MHITAHGGANKTSRNSKKFFQDISKYNVDVVEVDIWKCGKKLYLSHLPSFPCFRLPLSYAFSFIKKYDFKINCDVKQTGIVKDVLELAKKEEVLDRIIFTGSVSTKDLKHLYAGEVYLNKSFFKLLHPMSYDVKTIAAYIKKLNCPRISGINFRHTFLTDKFLSECKKHSLPISTFVVNKEKDMDRLISHQIIANITSNVPGILLEKTGTVIEK